MIIFDIIIFVKTYILTGGTGVFRVCFSQKIVKSKATGVFLLVIRKIFRLKKEFTKRLKTMKKSILKLVVAGRSRYYRFKHNRKKRVFPNIK